MNYCILVQYYPIFVQYHPIFCTVRTRLTLGGVVPSDSRVRSTGKMSSFATMEAKVVVHLLLLLFHSRVACSLAETWPVPIKTYAQRPPVDPYCDRALFPFCPTGAFSNDVHYLLLLLFASQQKSTKKTKKGNDE